MLTLILLMTALNSWGAVELYNWLNDDDGGSPSDTPEDEIPIVPVDPDPEAVSLLDGVVTGTSGADNLTPTNSLLDGQTITTINADAGNDTISGSLGPDSILGEAGDDLMHVLANGSYSGGEGADEFDIEINMNHWWIDDDLALSDGVIEDFTPAEDQLVLSFRSVGDQLALSTLAVADEGVDSVISFDYEAITGTTTTVETATIRIAGAAGLTLDDLAIQLDDDESLVPTTSFENELMDGTAEADTIDASGEHEALIRAGAGADTVTGASNGTVARLGVGDDTFTGAGEGNVVLGEEGDDVITTSATSQSIGEIERLYGGVGNDTIFSVMEESRLFGGYGDDRIMGAAGASISGGEGDDIISISREFAAAGTSVLRGDQGNDTLVGSDTDDVIRDHARTVTGRDVEGFDTDSAAAGEGNDTIVHSIGNDTMMGGDGNDLIYSQDHFFNDNGASTGDVSFDGGAGDDTIVGNRNGTGVLTGGAGNDLLVSGMERTEHLAGATDYTREFGDTGADTLLGGDGDDTIIFDRADSVTAGAGADDLRLDLHAEPEGMTGTATVTDFDRTEDVLTLFVQDPATVVLSVENGATSSTVLIDGTVVLTVDGVTDLSTDDISLNPYDGATDGIFDPTVAILGDHLASAIGGIVPVVTPVVPDGPVVPEV